ncbi:MAG TPA: glycogen synthase GlgA [Thiotrichales bacterium]|nr:glycogen synthase GlgA [Thiotrichales bacterium]
MKILFATSEALPLIKTGGLADVSGSLPPALRALGAEVRLILPAYRGMAMAADAREVVSAFPVEEHDMEVRLLEGHLGESGIPVWLVDAPSLFDRPGGPYADPKGRDWPDNAGRFALFARAICAVALDHAWLDWKPDVVHTNDWQTGLVPALLAGADQRPATLFTIHNLAYQGLFPGETFTQLHLPAELWSPNGLEFYGRLSFIKGGLAFADRLTTVSPTYAREICTPEYGYGLEGLLQYRSHVLHGVLNGVDYSVWSPENDPFIRRRYTPRNVVIGKPDNKRALQERFGLPLRREPPLIGMVSRLVSQKGIDLVLEALPGLLELGIQLVVVGTGERRFEEALREAAAAHPRQVAVHIGYDEALAHQVEAGADMFLMPSRFEPCGMNQMYSLRYGTVPIVRQTGGLADTVVDTNPETVRDGSATGFLFRPSTAQALRITVQRAVEWFGRRSAWRAVMRAGMRQDFSWERSARTYLKLYRLAMEDRNRKRDPLRWQAAAEGNSLSDPRHADTHS